MLVLARRIGRIVLATALAAFTVLGIAVAGAVTTVRDGNRPASHADAGAEHPPSGISGQGPIVVAVVLGQTGNDAGDVLAPYEVFASSARFSVYAVAATAEPVRLVGGPALVPALTFAMVDAGAAPKPDVVVIPAVEEPAGEREASMRTWVINQAARGARILAVCAGSRLLAATGLLDDKVATSHWSRISALRKTNPKVTWLAGERYVQDGLITTTAGVSSAIPGSLRLVHELAGPAEAQRVGRSFNFPGWSLDTPRESRDNASPSLTWA